MKRPYHDTRPRWDDPELPVFGKSGRAIDYHKMKERAKIALSISGEPDWRDDPTYNLRRKNDKRTDRS